MRAHFIASSYVAENRLVRPNRTGNQSRYHLNIWRPEQIDRNFADDIFNGTALNENIGILFPISL